MLQDIVDAHHIYVNPAIKMLKTSFFDLVSKLDDDLQDAMASLVVRQYMSKVSQDGKVFNAAGITDK